MILRVADSSEVSVARRATGDLARELGLDETRSGRAALVVTEMATNLLKHAGGGQIVLDRLVDHAGGLELLSLDKGDGIADLPRALEDGVSSVGSAGTGLGAIRRQADRFAAFSRPGLGTAVMARLYRKSPPTTPDAVTIGAVVAPYPGEKQCGDGWAYANSTKGPSLLSVDGSGHGRLAELAARTAIDAFHNNREADGPRLVESIHRALAPTRGAAVAVARVDQREHVVRFVGVGNISGAMIAGNAVRRMVSHNGTAGHIAPRIREFTYPYDGSDGGDVTVVLHSDGISAKWDLDSYPGLAASHPSLIAGILFRDHRRSRDDASIAVLRVATPRDGT
jgi:anti-sigma regulatory factor (Ser/Thr protein kinase)